MAALVGTRPFASLWDQKHFMLEDEEDDISTVYPLPNTPCADGPDESPRSHLQPRPSSSSSGSPNSTQRHPSPLIRRHSKMAPRSDSAPFTANPITVRLRNAHSSASSSPLVKDPIADSTLITSPRYYMRALNDAHAHAKGNLGLPALGPDRDHTCLRELKHGQKSAPKVMEPLLRNSIQETAMEKVQAVILVLGRELDKERIARKKAEMENKRLSKSLAESYKAVSKAENELEKERQARQLIEDVCDELLREIGDDKAEMEKLKNEHTKLKEEMEEERRMLQVSEALREERVQMKLAEARIELEERCMALDDLNRELQSFLDKDRKMHNAHVHLEEARKVHTLQKAVDTLQSETNASIGLLLQQCTTMGSSASCSDTGHLHATQTPQPSRSNGAGNLPEGAMVSTCWNVESEGVIDPKACEQSNYNCDRVSHEGAIDVYDKWFIDSKPHHHPVKDRLRTKQRHASRRRSRSSLRVPNDSLKNELTVKYHQHNSFINAGNGREMDTDDDADEERHDHLVRQREGRNHYVDCGSADSRKTDGLSSESEDCQTESPTNYTRCELRLPKLNNGGQASARAEQIRGVGNPLSTTRGKVNSHSHPTYDHPGYESDISFSAECSLPIPWYLDQRGQKGHEGKGMPDAGHRRLSRSNSIQLKMP